MVIWVKVVKKRMEAFAKCWSGELKFHVSAEVIGR